MSRNSLSIFGGILLLGLGAFGYWLYQDQQRSGVELSVGGRSIVIETR